MKIYKKYVKECAEWFAEVEGALRQVVLVDGFVGEVDGFVEFHRSVNALPHFLVCKDGKVWQFGDSRKRALRGSNVACGAVFVALEAAGALGNRLGEELPVGVVPWEYCTNCKFRGSMYWDMYTDRQLRALGELLLMLNGQIGRWLADPKLGGEKVSVAAEGGVPGVYFYGSFMPGAVGCHPQPDLVKLVRKVAAESGGGES